jgi:hypothetical protein
MKDRRSFLKLVGAAPLIGVISHQLLTGLETDPAKEKKGSALVSMEADVLVIGAGPSGITAAAQRTSIRNIDIRELRKSLDAQV